MSGDEVSVLRYLRSLHDDGREAQALDAAIARAQQARQAADGDQDPVTVDQVLGQLPVDIQGWKGVPEGYMPGVNDALALCREGVRMAFAAAASRRAPAAPRSDAPR